MKNKKIVMIISAICLCTLITLGVFFALPKKEEKVYQGEPFLLEDIYYHNGEFIPTNASEIEQLLSQKKNFLVFTKNSSYCSFKIPCDQIFEEVMKKYNIDVLKIPFEEFKDTSLYETVKYEPTMIVIKEGEIVGYLHADKDEDLDRYQNTKAFEKWLKQFIVLKK